MSGQFRLPPYRRSHTGFGIASAAVHVVAIVFLLTYSGSALDRMVTAVDPGGGTGEVRLIVLPSLGPQDGTARGRNPAAPDTVPTRPREVAMVPPPEVPTGIQAVEPPPPAEVAGGVPQADAAEGAIGVRLGRALLGPRLGDGRLWIRPRDAIAAAIAEALGDGPFDPGTHLARLDSAVAVSIYAFLDTLPRDSMAVARAPDWVTEINGQKWGIDGSWIYLGGLKLPSAILALLPVPQGNFDEARRAADLGRIREDIIQAARRAETADQFRRYVNETRERRNAERERQRNQRIVPRDSVKT